MVGEVDSRMVTSTCQQPEGTFMASKESYDDQIAVSWPKNSIGESLKTLHDELGLLAGAVTSLEMLLDPLLAPRTEVETVSETASNFAGSATHTTTLEAIDTVIYIRARLSVLHERLEV